MHLNIKNDDTYQLAAELAGLTGETLTATVTIALRERLDRVKRRRSRRSLVDELDEIALAKATQEPLLFKGHHFAQTDLDAVAVPDGNEAEESPPA